MFSKIIKNLLGIITLGLSLTACQHNPLITPITVNEPQDVNAYIPAKTRHIPLLSDSQQQTEANKFLKKFFAPWDTTRDFLYMSKNKSDSILATQKNEIRNFYRRQTFGINFQPHSKVWVDKIAAQMNLGNYPNRNRSAIVINHTGLRALPTAEPAFYDFRIAGEGYPFDNLQYSSLWVGTPLHVSHLSRDGAWALVVSPLVAGWVNVNDIAYVNPAFVRNWQSGRYVAVTANRTPVRDASGTFRFNAQVGTLLPYRANAVLIPVKDTENNAVIKAGRMPANTYTNFPLRVTPDNFARVMNSILGEPYGWGGLYGFRDCSQTMLDLFTPFGISLPRNSHAQLTSHPHVNLKSYDASKKREYIIRHGKPFLTLIGMPGHIMLYIGPKQGHAMVFQDVWGLGTKDFFNNRGRAVIGKTVITPLDFGRSIPGVQGTLLQGVTTMTYLDS